MAQMSPQSILSLTYQDLLGMNLGHKNNLENTNLMHIRMHVAGDNLCVMWKAKHYCPVLGHLSYLPGNDTF